MSVSELQVTHLSMRQRLGVLFKKIIKSIPDQIINKASKSLWHKGIKSNDIWNIKSEIFPHKNKTVAEVRKRISYIFAG